MLQPSILFVDDEPAILMAYQRGMRVEAADWIVQIAGDPVHALTLLANGHIDVVVSDLMMPVMSGADLTREVLLRYPWVIRIILSGMVDERSIAKGTQWSERYLAKPCPLAEVCKEIRQAMESREKDRALMPKGALLQEERPKSRIPSVLQIEDNQEEIGLLNKAFFSAACPIEHQVLPSAVIALDFLDIHGEYANFPRPDVIVLDLKSPDSNNYEFLTRYRLQEGPKAPVVVVSNSTNANEQNDALRHGAATYYNRPRTWDQYLELARSVSLYARLVARG